MTSDRIRSVMWATNTVLDGPDAVEVNETALKNFGCHIVESFESMRTHCDGWWPDDMACSVGYVLETLQ